MPRDESLGTIHIVTMSSSNCDVCARIPHLGRMLAIPAPAQYVIPGRNVSWDNYSVLHRVFVVVNARSRLWEWQHWVPAIWGPWVVLGADVGTGLIGSIEWGSTPWAVHPGAVVARAIFRSDVIVAGVLADIWQRVEPPTNATTNGDICGLDFHVT